MSVNLGEKLRESRRRVRLSQTAVGRFLDVTRQTIGGFERNERSPDVRQLAGMSNLYRLTLDELLGGVRSVSRDEADVRFHARTKPNQDIDKHDRDELVSFDKYLRHRTGHGAVLELQRRPFETVEQFVQRWRTDGPGRELGLVVPVPVFPFVARQGIEIRFTALEQLSGALLPGGADHPDGVLINSDQPLDRGRYTVGHELGHLAWGHNAQGSGCQTMLGRRFATEAEADQFASSLLMPASKIPEVGEEVNDALTHHRELKVRAAHRIFLMARRFLVSYQAMLVRLSQLGALGGENAEKLQQERPSLLARDLELQEREGTTPFNLAGLPALVRKTMPDGWQRRADAEAVRLLQTVAYSDYVATVPDSDRSDPPGEVYESVALWVADKFPLVKL